MAQLWLDFRQITMNYNLPFNWFDVAVLLMVMIGYTRGRKRGMSVESISMVMWIVIAIVSAIAYEPLGLMIDSYAKLGKLTSFLIAYTIIALGIALAFSYVKQTLGKKLTGSDAFGKSEYYLGIPAGMVRFACVVMVFLALLNARYYSIAEIKAQTKYDLDNYGSSFFPHLYSVQDDVFRKSFVGSNVKKHLDFLLIKSTNGHGVSAPVVKRKEFSLP